MKYFKILLLALVAIALSTPAWAIKAKWHKYGARFTEEAAAHGTPASGFGEIYVIDNANTMTPYFIDDAGNISSLIQTSATTAWDDIGDPDANSAIDFTDYYTSMDFGDTDADMFTVYFTGAFGDYTGFKLEQKTGNPTNGTILEIELADTDVDFISLSTATTEKVNIASDGSITLSVGDLTLTAGDLSVGGDMVVTGTYSVNAITASTATQTLVLNGNSSGGVDIGSTSLGNVEIGDDLVIKDTYNVLIGEGKLTVDNDQNEDTVVIESSASTTGSAIKITSSGTTDNVFEITADDLGSSGAMIFLDSDNIAADNFFIEAHDGSNPQFTVSQYGAIVARGNASTDIITITTGDLQISAGDIDLDNGNLMVNTSQDLGSNITRAYAGVGGSPVLTVKDDHTSTTAVTVLIESDGTTTNTLLQLVHDGDNPFIDIDAPTARTGPVIDILMTNQEAEKALVITGAATSATGEGVIEVHVTGTMAGALLRLDYDTGAPAAIDGYVLEVDDDSTAQAGKFAVEINSETNEALYVSKGLSKFTELVTFTGGLDSDGDVDVDFSANTEEMNVTSAAEYGADGAMVTLANTTADIGTNNSYMLRLRYTDTGQTNADFMIFEDAGGTDQLAINNFGDIVMGGATGTGGVLVTSFTDETGPAAIDLQTVTAFITTGGAGEDANTLANGVVGQIKIFVSTVESGGAESWKLTPGNTAGWTKITFDGTIGEGCILIYTAAGWAIIANNGGVIT